MSNREICVDLLSHVPDDKIGYAPAYLQGLTADEEADDGFCERMAENYLRDPEREIAYSLEDRKKEWGID